MIILDLLPTFIALLISAVIQEDLVRIFAIVEITYKLMQLSLWFLRMIRRESRHKRCPSNSAKLNGRRRQRR